MTSLACFLSTIARRAAHAFAAVAITVLLAGCAGHYGFKPVAPGQPAVSAAFGASVPPPSGTGWWVKHGRDGDVWGVIYMHPSDPADGKEIGETAFLYVTLTKPDYAALRKGSPTDRAMLQCVVDQSELLNMQGPRFTKIAGATTFRRLLGTEVAWFDQTWEERGNNVEPDAVLVLHHVGLACVDPRDRSRGIFLLASHRIRRGAAAQFNAAGLAEEAARGLTLTTPKG
jgi:hypothetical protein